MTIIMRVVSLLIGYCFGMITFGYIFGLLMHVDLRSEGSGNVGSTNTLRVLGNGFGFLTLFCDCMKVAAAAGIVYLLYHGAVGAHIHLLMLYAGLGAVLGHNYPAVMGFKGGKGIACSLGVLCVCFPQTFIPIAIIFIGTVYLTRYVSVGSLVGIVSFAILSIVVGQMGWSFFDPQDLIEAYVILGVMVVLAFWQHRENLGRLVHGEERKFSFHHKDKDKE